jgi:hypothetical protein
MVKKIVKFLLYIALFLAVIVIAGYFIMDEPVPDGTKGNEAELLADEMLNALNKNGYDSLKLIEFSYEGIHHYQWNKLDNTVNVKWDEQDIFLNLNNDVHSYSLLELKAYEYFINDSFWLVAPFKVRDAGVIRSTVDVSNARGLLVTYTSGGVTPGDSYLWIIDSRGFPSAWKLWTSNIPLGGVKFGWEGWEKQNGVWFSTVHNGNFKNISITNLKVR